MAVPTALTVQGPEGVKAVHPIDADVVRAQLREVLPLADVVKVGMCGTGAVVRMLAQELRAQTLVLDPVLVSSSGAILLDEPEALLQLASLAALVTPNRPELEALPGLAELGVPVLLKGGHGQGELIVDELLGVRRWEHPRLDLRDAHGTGCALSAAIVAGLAKGRTLEEAIDEAQRWLWAGMARGHWLSGR